MCCTVIERLYSRALHVLYSHQSLLCQTHPPTHRYTPIVHHHHHTQTLSLSTGKAEGAEGPEKAKRKGRFHIVEEESFNGDKRAYMARTGSSTGASHDGGSSKALGVQTTSPTQQAVGMLLGPLKELQDQLQGVLFCVECLLSVFVVVMLVRWLW